MSTDAYSAYQAQLAAERKQEREDDAALVILVGEIADALGEGWTSGPGSYDRSRKLTGPDDAVVTVARDWRDRTRLDISSTLTPEQHKRKHYDAKLPSITVSATRTPKAIAGEITRRVLPGYLPILAQCKASVIAANEATVKRDETVARLRAVMPAAHSHDKAEEYRRRVSIGYQYKGPVSGDAETSGDGSTVKVTLTGPTDLILAALALLFAEGGE